MYFLRSKYSIDLKDNATVATPSTSISTKEIAQNMQENSSKQTKKQKITDYFKRVDSAEYVVSKMASLDGLAFKTFCTSEELRKLFSTIGHPESVIRMVIQAYEELKFATIEEIQQLKLDGVKFCCNFRRVDFYEKPKILECQYFFIIF